MYACDYFSIEGTSCANEFLVAMDFPDFLSRYVTVLFTVVFFLPRRLTSTRGSPRHFSSTPTEPAGHLQPSPLLMLRIAVMANSVGLAWKEQVSEPCRVFGQLARMGVSTTAPNP
eukprot:3435606-Rhodomonas_salina.2